MQKRAPSGNSGRKYEKKQIGWGPTRYDFRNIFLNMFKCL